jgi:hypothetical protein
MRPGEVAQVASISRAASLEDHAGKKSPPSLTPGLTFVAALPKRDAHVIIPQPPQNDGSERIGSSVKSG